MTNRYRTPGAFEQALKTRIKARVQDEGGDFNRSLQTMLFERFLARVYDALGNAVILKGGLAMELRLMTARTTRDVDLRVEGDLDDIMSKIRLSAAQQGEDFLTFDLGDEVDFEDMLGEQVVYGGRRLSVQAKLAGKAFGGRFRLDLSLADRILSSPDIQLGSDLLEFANIAPVIHRIYPATAHVAEKLHALTMERSSPNSRVKDLIDVALLATHVDFESEPLLAAIEATFESRSTHDIPSRLPEPPEFWKERYTKMQNTDPFLPWTDINDVQAIGSGFLNPVLDQSARKAFWSASYAVWTPLA